jgi:hypothetical protein
MCNNISFQLGYHKPHLLGNEYTRLDFSRRPMRKDVGTQMLYRDAHMTGKTNQVHALLQPITRIGLVRFSDHE